MKTFPLGFLLLISCTQVQRNYIREEKEACLLRATSERAIYSCNAAAFLRCREEAKPFSCGDK